MEVDNIKGNVNHQDEPLMVTIRCITYNHEPYIRQCLDGFVMQKTNFRFEAIVHDDASTDGTATVIREYAEKYPDIIKPIYETENQYSKHDGSLQRIMSAHMRGKYIAVCEGDDYWIDPLKLQKQVDFLEANPEYGLVYTNVDFYFQEQNKFERNYITSGKLLRSYDFISHLVNSGYIAPCTWLYRKEYMQTYTQGYVDGTFPLALDIWANSKIYFLDEVTTVYRVIGESASHSRYLKKRFAFGSGVFRIQKDYIEKYRSLVSDEMEEKIYMKTYSALLPAAVALEKKEFVREARIYLKGKRMPLLRQILLCLSDFPLIVLWLRLLYWRRKMIL